MMKTTLLFLTVISFSFVGRAQAWYPLGPDDNNQPVTSFSEYFASAISPSGVPYILFPDMLRNGSASVRKYESGQWQYVGQPAFTPNPGVGGNPVKYLGQAIDPAGVPYAMYCSGTTGRLSVSRFTGGAWSPVGPTVISVGEAMTPSITIDNAGIPYIIYRDQSIYGKLWVKKFDGTNWVDVGGNGIDIIVNGVFMDISPAGIPYIAYISNDTLTVAKFNGSNWVTIGNTEMKAPLQYTIRLDNAGEPCVSGIISSNIVIKKFNGSAWVNISPANVVNSTLPEICFDQLNNLYLAYTKSTVTEKYVFLKKYSGGIWTTIPSIFEGDIIQVDMMVDNSNQLVVNGIAHSGIERAFSRKFNGSDWVTLGEAGLTKNDGGVLALVENNGIPFMLTTDDLINEEPFTILKRFNAGQWEQVGDTLWNFQGAGVAMDASGNAYTVDNQPSSGIKMKKMAGGVWTSLPDVGMATSTTYPAIAVDASGVLYVMFSDAGNSQKATVKKFNGSSWVTVGQAGFSAFFISYNFITFDHNNVPYAATGVQVFKLNGALWQAVGSSFGSTYSMTIGFDQANVPWISYSKNDADSRARVQKFNGSAWVDVVSGGAITGGAATTTKILFNNSNVPYVAYTEKVTQNNFVNRVSVKKFNGTTFELVGTRDVSAGEVGGVEFLLLHGAIPVILYSSTQVYARSFSNWALPVTLLQFTANRSGNNAVLKWTSVNESGLREYAVERSTNGTVFSTAGFVTAMNTTGEHAYSFTDDIEHVSTGKIFYRLKLLEKEGGYSYSKVAALTKNTNLAVTIYPNPVRDVLRVNTGNVVYNIAVVCDMSGKTVASFIPGSASPLIPVTSLASGRYTLTLCNGEGCVTLSFIKQ
jgi:hypothetical protein